MNFFPLENIDDVEKESEESGGMELKKIGEKQESPKDDKKESPKKGNNNKEKKDAEKDGQKERKNNPNTENDEEYDSSYVPNIDFFNDKPIIQVVK